MENDEWLDGLASAAAEVDANPAIINPPRLRDMKKAESIVSEMIAGQKVKMTGRYNEPFKSTGSINLETKSLNLHPTKDFVRAALLADNVDIYPMTTGKIMISFGFNSLAIPIMEEDI